MAVFRPGVSFYNDLTTLQQKNLKERLSLAQLVSRAHPEPTTVAKGISGPVWPMCPSLWQGEGEVGCVTRRERGAGQTKIRATTVNTILAIRQIHLEQKQSKSGFYSS